VTNADGEIVDHGRGPATRFERIVDLVEDDFARKRG
jgi:hypothetical protein